MENIVKESLSILLKISPELNEKLKNEGQRKSRKRHAQIIYILESFFAERELKGSKKE